MAYRVSNRSRTSSPSQSSADQQPIEDTASQKTGQSEVTCMYHAHIAGFWRNLTVIWSQSLMNYSLNISVDSLDPDNVSSCKIDLKPWNFWAKKGSKSFEVDGNILEAYWDLRSAKFSGSPEPISDYYVALVSEEEVVLLLGDCRKKAYKRAKSRPALVEAVMFYKIEHVFGKKSFSTRAKFDRKKREHDIVVESSLSGPRDPEMWISIDGIVLIHVMNLQWKFRGNQTVQVNKQAIDVFWDVHSWLFCTPGSNHGLFIFKLGTPEEEVDAEDTSLCDETNSSANNSMYYSTQSYSNASKFCLSLYAWKTE